MEEASMERQEMPRHTEGQLPRELTYGLLGSLNAEHKCLELTLMAANPQKVHSRIDLYREVMDHQDPNRRWKMGNSLPFQHCEQSLAPIGLVAKEALSDEGGWGYIITEYGTKTGIHFAGGLLKWSYEHPNFSLYQMLGSTHSSSARGEQPIERKRAPETRYKLLFEIATSPTLELREVDLVNAISEVGSITSKHLTSLGKNKIITYQAVEQGKPFVNYRLKDDAPLDKQPEPLKRKPTLSFYVFEVLKENKGNYLSHDNISDFLIEKYPNYIGREKESLRVEINMVLRHLEKQGYLEREKFIGKQFLSEVIVSDEQREAIVSLLEFIDKFEMGDSQTLKEGKEFAQIVASNPTLFSSLILKAKEASPYANRTDRETMEAHILSILDGNPDITINRIAQLLEQRCGKKILHENAYFYLQRLAQNGTIIGEKTKAGNVYRVAEEENQVIPSN